jgi:hypothetical protein
MARLGRTVLLATLLASAGSAPAAALTITILSGAGRSTAWDATGPTITDEDTLLSPPYASGPVAAVDGASSAITSHDLTNSVWLISFSHARTGGSASLSVAASDDPGQPISFRVSEPVTAVLSGSYDVTDTGAGDRVRYEVVLSGDAGATLHMTVAPELHDPERIVRGRAARR